MTQPERIRPRVRALLVQRGSLSVKEIAEALALRYGETWRALAHRWFEQQARGNATVYGLSEQGRKA